jgi:hypothetical protein
MRMRAAAEVPCFQSFTTCLLLLLLLQAMARSSWRVQGCEEGGALTTCLLLLVLLLC